MTDSNYYAENGFTETNASVINGINISDGWVEMAYFEPNGSGINIFVTDISLSANKDGIFRVKYDGNIMKVIYTKAREPIFILRNLPFPVQNGKKFAVEFKAESDDTNVSVCIAGYEK